MSDFDQEFKDTMAAYIRSFFSEPASPLPASSTAYKTTFMATHGTPTDPTAPQDSETESQAIDRIRGNIRGWLDIGYRGRTIAHIEDIDLLLTALDRKAKQIEALKAELLDVHIQHGDCDSWDGDRKRSDPDLVKELSDDIDKEFPL